MHVNLPEFLLYPQFLLLLSDNVSMAEYHKAYLKVDLNPVDMTIQAFFRICFFFFLIKRETPVFWLLYCLFGIRKLQYVYSINVNLSQKQDNILVCSSLCKCCSGGAV